MIGRKLSESLHRSVRQFPVVLLTGPRQSGKTTLCKQSLPDWEYVNLEVPDTRRFAMEDPRAFLERYSHRVIFDEIQRAPELTSYLQALVDEKQTPGQFVLTGSQQFEVIEGVSQSLAGRTAVLRLLPLSYEECFGAKKIPIPQLIHRGFYPRLVDPSVDPTLTYASYVSTYIERDLRQLSEVKNLSAFEQFVRLCATYVGQVVNQSKLASAIGVDQKTVRHWLSLLQASYILWLLPPHFENLKKRVVKSPKLYFYDVGLAAFLLGITQPSHVDTHPLRGALFENFVVTEFLKNRLNQGLVNNLYYFRTHSGLEVDLLLDEGQRLLPIEIKTSQTFHAEFTKSLSDYVILNPKAKDQRGLVYAGQESFQFKGTQVVPYWLLNSLLKNGDQ